jgi:hypothetical protein
VKKKVKWPIVTIYVRNIRWILKHILHAWIREEELREDKYINSLGEGLTIHFCEPEKGVMLGVEYEVR